jgi:EamA domain-containing membrane protein RarD
METLGEIVLQYQTVSILLAATAVLIAALVLGRFRVLAIILVIFSAFIFYVLIHGKPVLKDDINTIKEKTQEKTIENIQ